MPESRVLQIIIEAKNNAQKELSVLGKQLDALQPTFQKMALVGTAGLGALSVGIGGAIKNASDLTESINAVNVVFGEGAKTVLDFSNTTSTAIGMASADFNQMATQTGALLRDTGLSAEEVANQTINLTKRASDMASVFNTSVPDAMSALNQALRGETEAIRRYAGDVTDASLQTYLLSKGIKTSVTDLSEQEKRLYRVDLIMAQTAVTAGDFERTSEGLANSQRILQSKITDTSAKLGTMFIPMMEDAMVVINKVVTVVSNFIDKNPELAKTLVLVAGAVSGLLVVAGSLGLLIPSIISGFGLLKGVVIALRTAMLSLSSVGIMAVVTVLGILALKLYETRQEVSSWGDVWNVIGLSIMSQTSKMSAWVIEMWGKMLNAIGKDGDTYIEQAKGMRTESEYLALEAENIKDKFAEQSKQLQETTTATTGLAEATSIVIPAMAGAGKETNDLTSNLEDLKKEYVNLQTDGIKSIRTLTEESSKNLAKLQEDYASSVDSIKKLQAEFQKGLVSDQQSVAEEVIRTEERIAEIKADIEEKKKDITEKNGEEIDQDNQQSHNDALLRLNKELEQLQAKLDKENQALKDSADFQISIEGQITEARRVAGLTDLQRAIENYNSKRKIAEQEFNDKAIQLIKEIEVIKLKEQQEIALYLDKTTQIKGLMIKANEVYQKGVRDNLATTEQAINREIELYRELARQMSASQGANSSTELSNALLGTRATGGAINQTGMYKLHEGEYILPKNNQVSGQSIVVNINGGTYLSEEVSEEIGNNIIKQLKTQMAI